MEGARNSISQTGVIENKSAVMPSSRLDFLKALAKSGRACCNQIAGRHADGMDAYQIWTKSRDGANLKKFRGDSVCAVLQWYTEWHGSQH